MSGRPLRFLGATLALWTLGRIAILMPEEPERARRRESPSARTATSAGMRNAAWPGLAPDAAPRRRRVILLPRPLATKPVTPPLAPVPTMSGAIPDAAIPTDTPAALLPPFIPSAWPPPAARPDRWSASLWAIARQGVGTLTPGGQLGGTQAGLRLVRRLDRHGDLSASLRLSAPIEGVGREMALGLDWSPWHGVPLHILAERRVALDSGQDGTALLAVAGFGPRAIAPGVSVAAYAQGGVVARRRIDSFADGAARLSATLTPGLDLGLGLWGGAQRDARRLDIGPTLGLALPVVGRRVRLSLDWRQRVAGRAAPDSGPALSLAGDF